MNIFRKAATGALVLTFGIGLAGVVAQDAVPTGSGDASVCVEPRADEENQGALSVLIADADFGTIAYDDTNRTLTETITVNVTDDRGVVGDWVVAVSGTNFESDEGASFPIEGNLEVFVIDPVVTTTPGILSTYPATVPLTGVGTSTIIQGDGVGTLNEDFDFAGSELTIPVGTLVGEYQSTLTVTITATGDNSDACEPEEEEETEAYRVGVVRNS